MVGVDKGAVAPGANFLGAQIFVPLRIQPAVPHPLGEWRPSSRKWGFANLGAPLPASNEAREICAEAVPLGGGAPARACAPPSNPLPSLGAPGVLAVAAKTRAMAARGQTPRSTSQHGKWTGVPGARCVHCHCPDKIAWHPHWLPGLGSRQGAVYICCRAGTKLPWP